MIKRASHSLASALGRLPTDYFGTSATIPGAAN
jgi:hypothetical protein